MIFDQICEDPLRLLRLLAPTRMLQAIKDIWVRYVNLFLNIYRALYDYFPEEYLAISQHFGPIDEEALQG